MNLGVRSLGKCVLPTCTIPTAQLVTIVSKSCPMVMVYAGTLIGLILFVVIAISMLPMAMMKAHLPLTIPAIPYRIGGTTVGTLP